MAAAALSHPLGAGSPLGWSPHDKEIAMTDATPAGPPAPLTTRVKVGLALAVLLALADLLGSLLVPVDPSQVGPPLGVIVLAGILGAVTLVFVVIAWLRRSRGAIRIVAGTRILSAVTALPAFFAGPPAPFVLAAAIGVTVTVVAVALMLSPARRAVPVQG
jgi:hypothetical protein